MNMMRDRFEATAAAGTFSRKISARDTDPIVQARFLIWRCAWKEAMHHAAKLCDYAAMCHEETISGDETGDPDYAKACAWQLRALADRMRTKE